MADGIDPRDPLLDACLIQIVVYIQSEVRANINSCIYVLQKFLWQSIDVDSH